MAARLTRANLDAQVSLVNGYLGRPDEPYTIGEDGRYHANIGNVHLSGAYGGWRVDVMDNDGGGTRTLTDYHAPMRETYAVLRGMVAVLREAGRP